MAERVRLGATLPLADVGGDAATAKAFALEAERLGYDFLGAPDHVLGNAAADWGQEAVAGRLYHDPFVLFAYLACCTERIGFSTEVLILPQRQTALVAKQAASLAVLSGGRFRLGIGVGWNEPEFVGLNESFANRGRRSEEQLELLRLLWAEPTVELDGRWHRMPGVGINPRPAAGRVPLWLGGHEEVTLRRIAQWGDGWIMLAHPPGDEAVARFEALRRYAREAGRDPAEIGIGVWTSTAEGGPDDWRRELAFWKQAGVSHVTLNSTFGRYHHKRLAGTDMAAHLTAIRQYRETVADLL